MSREIKFRAWDGEEMLTNSVRREYDDYYTLDLDGTFYGHTRTGDEYFNADQDYLNKKQYVLMQYTGLKDKHGKEIYEGDIVKVEYFDSREMMGEDAEYTDVVYWENTSAGFMIKRPIGADSLENDLGKSIEVVGNIYENSTANV